MNDSLKILANRLPRYTGRGDKYLAKIAQDLRQLLWKTQRQFTKPACRLGDILWMDLAVLLVEWGEDIHNDIGLWKAVEDYQKQVFGTPLPFIASSGTELTGFDSRRIQFFLWTVWPYFNSEMVLSPTHPDLQTLSEVASQFLANRFAAVPKDSGLKRFLSTPNDYGWDVKAKLLIVGINSYLFRFAFFNYLDSNEAEPDIPAKDEFVCTYCSEWAGLGVVDVLASVLDIGEEDRTALKSWYERHTSLYRVLTRSEEGGEVKYITARNILNGQVYTIKMNIPDTTFLPNNVIAGSLVPWRGEWTWSGLQRTCGYLPESNDPDVRKEMFRDSCQVAYRYCLPEAVKALEFCHSLGEKFVAYYGKDLVVFEDGLSLAASEQKRMRQDWESRSLSVVEDTMQRHNLTKPETNMNFPPDFLKHDKGIAAYYNRDEGLEYLTHFHSLIVALNKREVGLTKSESDLVFGLIYDRSISPAFVQKLVSEHSCYSVASVFCIENADKDLVLGYLFRRFKGQYFKRRYPSIVIKDV